ncbi:hypothetical protein D4S03_04335 [bacterium]|nr:MAG: hypothetical protein D4S03_04335 [bacterium]
MSKQRVFNYIIKCEKEDQVLSQEMESEILYESLANGKIPKDPYLKELARTLADFLCLNICCKIFPSMPSESWVMANKENPTLCQPLDWKEPIPHIKIDKPSIIKDGANTI